ncbi:glycosyltransferase family 2 protein [Myxococcota bacterium]|nr:glycosyltransferase family 2 protein [Myxococcota bacterium]MCZ7619765.1 glycosyltransferase family 2 protein [Myxococcota bacterium]
MSSARSGLTIVIVSWNTRELLLAALAAVLPLDPVRGEVIVVDNASDDGSPDAIEARFPDVRVIRNERNLGFAGGVNVGLRAAREPYVLLLNSDTLVRGDAIAKLLAYAEAHPKAGIVGPRVLNEDGSLQESRFRFPSLLNLFLAASYLYKLFPHSRWFNRERMGGADVRLPAQVDAVSGCCFLMRRDMLERIGLLDETFFMYAEETDLCWRAWRAGYEVHYAPVGEIVHLGGGSSRLARRRNFLEFRRSILRFFAKHRGRGQAELARVLLLAFLLLRVPYWAVGAARSRNEAREQLANYVAAIRFLCQPIPRLLTNVPTRPGP